MPQHNAPCKLMCATAVQVAGSWQPLHKISAAVVVIVSAAPNSDQHDGTAGLTGSLGGSTARVVCKTTPVGFEPTRGVPIGLAGRRLSRSAKVSSGHQCPTECAVQVDACDGSAVGGQWAAAKQNLRSTCAHSANRSQGVISTMAPLESVQVWTAALHALSANNTCGIRAHAGRPHRLSGPTP